MYDYLYYLFFLLFPGIITGTDVPAYTPTDLILFNCGALSKLHDKSLRSWETDEDVAAAFSSSHKISHVQLQQPQPSRIDQDVPYDSIRLFRSAATYSLSINTRGKKFVRLHFSIYPISGFDASKSLFSVVANGYTLLRNFSVFLTSQYLKQDTFVKEFLVDVTDLPRINLTFSPNPNSFAFVNGIEIVSIPEKLYLRPGVTKFLPDKEVELGNNTAFETLYRLNVGGADVRIEDDTGMFRYWTRDDDNIFGADYGYTPHDEGLKIEYTNATPAYSAPKIVYKSMRTMTNTSTSLEWVFPVDAGFNYLLRLHFCEFLREITKPNDRVFTIRIDNKTAEIEADVISWTGGDGIPIFKDYIAWVPDNHTHHGKKDLWLSLFPNLEMGPKYLSAWLSGLEIFKLSDSSRSLAAANPIQAHNLVAVNPIEDHSPGPTTLNSPPEVSIGKPASHIIVIVITIVIGISALVGVIMFSLSRCKLRNLIATKRSTPKIRIEGLGVSFHDLCKHFSLEEIKMATNNFDDSTVIGRGGFGNVYRGFISNGATSVAVKRLHASSNQGAQEFLTEIELLSKLRHLHLVTLIGYCDENREMILVYDYMPHGTLRDHLYNANNPPLTWKQRLQICLGAARGIDYLHNGTNHTIIHRDVKSTNILLDEKWVAKMSDFGLSKVFPSDASESHISTAVKGSFGYMDPEYYKRRQLTDKSDVYSLGVVLFEVLCARPAILPRSPEPDDQVNLAEWAKLCFQEGTIHQIVDSNLKDQIGSPCLDKFVETAIQCLSSNRSNRPSMNEVVRSLEFAIQLQEGHDAAAGSSDSPETAIELTERDSGLQSAEVFSDLVNPSGR